MSQLTLRPLNNLKIYPTTLFQGFEAIHLDRGKVREHIFTSILGFNEPESFGIVEPLDRACCHAASPLFQALSFPEPGAVCQCIDLSK